MAAVDNEANMCCEEMDAIGSMVEEENVEQVC